MRDGPFDSIVLRGIRAWGRHGANAGEQDVPQPLDIELDLMVDVHAARTSDVLTDTVDYAALHAQVVRLVTAERYRLLERLGEAILTAVMTNDKIALASITIAKPGLLDGATPSVTLSKMRRSGVLKPVKRRKRDKKK